MSTSPSNGDAAARVSVVIIFFNPGRFLTEAVESIFEQTYRHWELLLVDDGSSDESTAIAREYAAAHPDRIRYLEHPGHANLGMSAARNLGIKHATGKYLAFLDADDVYLPERLAKHVQVLEARPDVAAVQSDLIFWYSWQSPHLTVDQRRPFLAPGDYLLPTPQGLLRMLAVSYYSPGVCNITVRREVAVRLGGFEAQFRSLYEDQVFAAKIYLHETVYVLQDYLVKYRRHPESSVRRAKATGELVEGMQNRSTHAFHAWVRSYVNTSGVTEPLLHEIIAEVTAIEATRGMKRAHTPLEHSPLRKLLGAAVTQLKLFAKNALPRAAYSHLLVMVWERDMRRARREYKLLCERVQRAGLRHNLSI